MPFGGCNWRPVDFEWEVPALFRILSQDNLLMAEDLTYPTAFAENKIPKAEMPLQSVRHNYLDYQKNALPFRAWTGYNVVREQKLTFIPPSRVVFTTHLIRIVSHSLKSTSSGKLRIQKVIFVSVYSYKECLMIN